MSGFIAVNGASPLTTIPGFTPWRVLLWKRAVKVCEIFPMFTHQSIVDKGCVFTVVDWPWASEGIYPDLLHILDLAIYLDCYASSLLHWTDDASIFGGRSRDERLHAIYRKYLTWCVDNRCLSFEATAFLFFRGPPLKYKYLLRKGSE